METDKDNWLQGDFHSSSDYHHSLVLEAAARATANTCARIVFAIEEIKAQEEKGEE